MILDSEGFGLVFHEASACAKPVIAADVSGCKEAVVGDVTGLLVPPDDPQALADSIRYLLASGNSSRAGARRFSMGAKTGRLGSPGPSGTRTLPTRNLEWITR